MRVGEGRAEAEPHRSTADVVSAPAAGPAAAALYRVGGGK